MKRTVFLALSILVVAILFVGIFVIAKPELGSNSDGEKTRYSGRYSGAGEDGCAANKPAGKCTPGQTFCVTTGTGKECQYACGNSGTWSDGVDCKRLGKVCSSQGLGGKCKKPSPEIG